jgi:hypothetical protein
MRAVQSYATNPHTQPAAASGLCETLSVFQKLM